jgi:4-diphosphocytidyl-2-C-methyl-D-erythritol kinase
VSSIRIDCPAKVNLFLEILGKRDDGYHEISTVMSAVSLVDTLTLDAAKRDSFDVDPAGAAPVDPSNTVMKTLAALRRRVHVPPVRIRLAKRIPSGAGLGGGSSDAAGLIRAADRRFSLGLALETMQEVLAEVGSDTAFFATGGTALCAGRGEIVTPLPHPPPLHLVLICPPFDCPTGEVYRRLKITLTRRPRPVSRFLNSLGTGDPATIGRALYNRLEPAAFEFRPDLRVLRKELAGMGFLGALMSGSGSTVFGLCADAHDRTLRERAVQRRGWGRTVAVTTLPPS